MKSDKTVPFFILALLLLPLVSYAGEKSKGSDRKHWTVLSDVIPDIPFSKGLGGAFVGESNSALIVAGGSYFDSPLWNNGTKRYSDSIYVAIKKEDGYCWIRSWILPRTVAHGASVEVNGGVLCIGGKNDQQAFSDCMLLSWDSVKMQLLIDTLPSLPFACHSLSAAIIGNFVYVSGGMIAEKPSAYLWRLSLSDMREWEVLDTPPWRKRFGAPMIAQSNGTDDCLFLFGGKDSIHYLTDAYCYNPLLSGEGQWKRLAELPRPVLGALITTLSDSLIYIFSGSDGHDMEKINDVREKYEFIPTILAYNPKEHIWTTVGALPIGIVNSRFVNWNSKLVIAGGEIKPSIRTPKVFIIDVNK